MPGRFFIEFGEDLDCFSKTSHSAKSQLAGKSVDCHEIIICQSVTPFARYDLRVRVEPVEMQSTDQLFPACWIV